MRNKEIFAIPDFSRRDFLRIGGAGLVGYAMSYLPGSIKTLRAADANTINTARMCIFVFMYGGPSQLDTFDVKEGFWTPEDFDVVTYNNINLPRGLFPNLATAEMTQHMAIVRSIANWTNVHGPAEYWTFINQEFNPAFVKERPHVGAVVALEYADRRSSDDALPGFVALNGSPSAGAPVNRTVDNGFLSALYAPFPVAPNRNGVGGLSNPLGQDRFEEAWKLLQDLDGPNRNTDDPPMGKPQSDYNDFYNASKKMVYNPVVDNAFRFSQEDETRYGNTGFGRGCIVARNLAIADAGTAFVFLSTGFVWDNHGNIYGPNNLYRQCPILDTGLSNLVRDLAAAPGRDPKKTALDETLIVCMGDFGRTPPSVYTNTGTGLNQQRGRDHWKDAMFAVLIGGGVQGGRVIGATDDEGRRIEDRGWYGNGRPAAAPTRPEDINDTIYSALGIDWTKTIAATPSGRVYRYSPLGPYGPINELFEP